MRLINDPFIWCIIIAANHLQIYANLKRKYNDINYYCE